MLVIVASLAVGMAVDRYLPMAIERWWCLAVAGWCGWCLLISLRWLRCASAGLLLAIFALGGAWHHSCWSLVPAEHVFTQSQEEDQPLCFEAIVLSSPRIIPAPPHTPLRPFPVGDRSRCEIAMRRVRAGSDWRSATGNARLLVDGHLLSVQVGDVIRVFARYQRPSPNLNPGEFNFAEFERSAGRWISLSSELPECVQVVQTGSWWNARRWLDELRRNGALQIRQYVSPARAPLATAVMLGEREYLDVEQNERFLVTGTVHLLAISGLNLGILVYGFWFLGHLGWLSRRATLALAMLFVFSYTLLTDAEPPVLRAAVLISMFCCARWSGRPTSPWQLLSLAALVVLIANPAALFHVGAQLSFLAVAILSWYRHHLRVQPPSDPLDRLIASTRPGYVKAYKYAGSVIWLVFMSGALVWLFSMPLVWLRYNLISPIGLGLNPIVWLPMTIALFSGFALLVVSWLLPPLGFLLGWLCDGSLWLLEWVIVLGQPFPGGYHWLPAPSPAWVAVFYCICALAAVFPTLRLNLRWQVVLAGVWFTIAWWNAMPLPIRDASKQAPLQVSFVSVGHGAAVLLELPDGRTLLYDAGRLGAPLSGARPIAAVLWSRGKTHLDGVIISHADSDHYNALPELLERFSVGRVYVSTTMWNNLSAGLQKLRSAIDAQRIPLVELQAGDTLQVHSPHTRLEVLHPPRAGVLGSDNANSIVLLVEHAGKRLLLSGDLEDRGLTDLLAEEPLDCDVIMAPHHGSTRSNPTGFATWCRPEYVVISGGRDYELGRDYRFVQHAYEARGAKVYHLAEYGSTRFEISRNGITAQPHREPPDRE
jgi:competence protein ComEC